MIGSLLATMATILGQAPPPDRTGESTLRTMLQEISERDRYHALIFKSHREGGRQDFYPEGIVEIWRDRAKYRIEFADMWGAASTIVYDGKQVLDDSGSDPVVLRKPAKTWHESSPQLDAQGSVSSPWFYLSEGPSILDRLDKNQSITPGPNADSVTWNSSLFGSLTVTRIEAQDDFAVWQIEFDNFSWQKKMYDQFPEWFDAPNTDSRWRHKVVISRVNLSRGTFSTKPGRGRQVSDQTKVAKVPPV